MKKIKKVALSILGVTLLTTGLYSCSSDSLDPLANKDALISSKSAKTKFKVIDYTDDASRAKILDELSSYYLGEVYLNNEFDSRYQMAAAIFEDYKVEKKLVIKFDIINLDDMNFEELAAFIGGTNITYDAKEKGKEYLYHQCVGGKNDSKTLVLERPTGLGSAASYGKKVSDFAKNCLDNGGCVEVCKSTTSIRANVDSLVFDNESDRNEYQELLDLTYQKLLKKLESSIIEL